jgi:hypothetical protein
VFVGYSYRAGETPELERQSVVDRAGGMSCTGNSTSYWGSDEHLYLRFQLFVAGGGKIGAGNMYYSSFRVDSMYVGNGIIMKQGDISVIVSEQPKL